MTNTTNKEKIDYVIAFLENGRIIKARIAAKELEITRTYESRNEVMIYDYLIDILQSIDLEKKPKATMAKKIKTIKNIETTESYKRIFPAIEFFGSESALARVLGKKPGHVYLWKKTAVPAEIAKLIEEVSSGSVPRYVTRPDIFDRPKQDTDETKTNDN